MGEALQFDVVLEQRAIEGVWLEAMYPSVRTHRTPEHRRIPADVAPNVDHPITGLQQRPQDPGGERFPPSRCADGRRNMAIAQTVNRKRKRLPGGQPSDNLVVQTTFQPLLAPSVRPPTKCF